MQIYWHKRKRLHKKRIQLPQDWFGTLTWPPFHRLKHQYGRRDVMWKHSFNDLMTQLTVLLSPSHCWLVSRLISDIRRRTCTILVCSLENGKKFLLFFPACNAVSHGVEQNAVVLYSGFQRILFSYRYWWFAAKPRQRGATRREKRMTSGHRSYESHFHAILGSYYLIKTVWSWCVENEALENEDRSTKHPNLENEAP